MPSANHHFQQLKIVLEHCTTKDAIEAVLSCGPNVVGTITAHHLYLTVDDWADDAFNYCKPVAKWPSDRTALIHAAVSGSPKFFLGSDSAPHDIKAKKGGMGKHSAGVFTQPNLVGLVLGAFEEAIERKVITEDQVTEDVLLGFLGAHGKAFYGVDDGSGERIVLRKGAEVITASVNGDGVEVMPFRRNQTTWGVEWK